VELPGHLTQMWLFYIVVKPLSQPAIVAGIAMFLLLAISVIASGAEVSFFSINAAEIEKLRLNKSKKTQTLLHLIASPQKLQSTLLILNNLSNVGFVIVSTFFVHKVFEFHEHEILRIILHSALLCSIIIVFSEIIPKIIATGNALSFALMVAVPLKFLSSIFFPFTALLIYLHSRFNRSFSGSKSNMSIDDLSNAIDLASNTPSDEKKILKSIVKFGNIEAKSIMRPRIDVIAVEKKTSFSDLILLIEEYEYSRLPIYSETFDNIEGILYIKDLLPHLHEEANFNWYFLINPPFIIPESKMIDDLLQDFQTNKIHMAIVVDEYGGASGIITLEDVLEEIVGEIKDETGDDIDYTKIDDSHYIFEGKIQINDLYKIILAKDGIFDEIKGDADTLAGMILEIKGEIPKKGELIIYKNFTFRIISADDRRIKRVKLIIKPENEASDLENKNTE